MEDLKLATPLTKPIVLLNLWLYSILAKFLPCILMVIYGGLLLTTLRANLRQKLRRMSTTSIASSVRPGTDTSRTTRMLLVVIVLCVVTEVPQAVLIFLSVNLPNFFYDVYVPLGDLMDMLALINNGVNFVLYCSMSRDFRNTVVSLMRTGRDPTQYRNSACRIPASPMLSKSTGNNNLSINGFSPLHFGDSERSHTALMVRLSGDSSAETICTNCKS
ncbi:G-protein coupled receptor dmsr-1-like [Littorina saxatilis]|uniref:G-protein coupled receptor dmsr-1-like n=1 Tax=Littorina saxatilis TaxID=31220 RepID=UPI0038B4F517